jgi:hypothetical protein
VDDSFCIDVLRWGGADTGWLPIAAFPKDGESSIRSSFPS